MLTENKITFAAKSVINDTEIASFGAILNTDTLDLSIYAKQIDKGACKEHRDVVRKDQADFEDFAYRVQDMLKNA